MNSLHRTVMLRAVLAVGTLAAAAGFAGAAQAKILEPAYQGPMSGGFFHGLPIRPDTVASRPAASETVEVGENCYTVRRMARNAGGRTTAQNTQVCE